jgi:putative LysE/RhtB family amino acid efflux pump
MHPALVGFGLGFFVALQLGPMSLFLIRSTLRNGWAVGLAIGAGIAAIDGLYAALGAAGAAPFLAIPALRLALGLIGATVLIALGVRTLWSAFRVRLGGEVQSEVAGPRRAFVTSLGATASNPATIISWSAIFAAATAAGAADSTASGAMLVAGVAIGSATWGATLASLVALSRRRFSERALRWVDILAGAGIVGFGGALAYSTLRDS